MVHRGDVCATIRVLGVGVGKKMISDVPGIVLDVSPSGIDVATRAGVLRLLEVQRAGGKRLPVAEYIRAHAPAIGSVLGFASQGDAETVD